MRRRTSLRNQRHNVQPSNIAEAIRQAKAVAVVDKQIQAIKNDESRQFDKKALARSYNGSWENQRERFNAPESVLELQGHSDLAVLVEVCSNPAKYQTELDGKDKPKRFRKRTTNGRRRTKNNANRIRREEERATLDPPTPEEQEVYYYVSTSLIDFFEEAAIVRKRVIGTNSPKALKMFTAEYNEALKSYRKVIRDLHKSFQKELNSLITSNAI